MPCAHCYQSSHKECVANLINTNLFNDPVEHPSENQVKALINPFNIPGVHYLCKACDNRIIQNIAKKETSDTNITPEDPNEILESVSANKENVTENNARKNKEGNNISNTDQDETSYRTSDQDSNIKKQTIRDQLNQAPNTQQKTHNISKTPTKLRG